MKISHPHFHDFGILSLEKTSENLYYVVLLRFCVGNLEAFAIQLCKWTEEHMITTCFTPGILKNRMAL